jgi:hypothetical protein
MANPEGSANPEAEAFRSSRHSHRRSHHGVRQVARVLRVLALVIGILAISSFAYKAFVNANCSSDPATYWLGIKFSDDTCKNNDPVDESLRYDAAIAVVAAMVLIGSLEISRRIPKPRRR